MDYIILTALTAAVVINLRYLHKNTRYPKEVERILQLLDNFYEITSIETQDHIEETLNIFWNCPYDRILIAAGSNDIICSFQVDAGGTGNKADYEYECIRYLILSAMVFEADILVITRYDRDITAPHSICGFQYDADRYYPMKKSQLKSAGYSSMKNEFGETPVIREYSNGWY